MPVSGLEPYDDANVFARILRGEIPSRLVFENEHAYAMHDIGPQAPVHVLVLPRGAYVSFRDFAARANDAEIGGFFRTLGQVAQSLGLEEDGYRLIANHGRNAGQEVGHFHVHLLGGAGLGRLVAA